MKKSVRFAHSFFGVDENYRSRGIEAIIMNEMLNGVAQRNGVEQMYASWILESNKAMTGLIENVLAEHEFATEKFDICEYRFG